jgi:hypothetical protein
MKVLLPSTSLQTLKIIPRSYVEASNLSLVIKEDGTGKTETLTSLTSTIDGNYISIPCTFSILSEGSLYFMELKQGSSLLFRDKVYVTSQTDRKQKQTINSGKYTEHTAAPTGQKYITV